MSNKNKGKKQPANNNTKKAVVSKDDDDWDAILNEAISTNTAVNTDSNTTDVKQVDNDVVKEATATTNKTVDEADDDNDDDDDQGNTAGGKKDKKKKKKKPKKEESEASTKPVASAAPLSQAGKAILLRKQQQEAAEAKAKALREAEEKRIRDEEEAEERRLKAIQDEKDRKKKQKQDKIANQKAAGTYMTKTEKEKHRRMQERLEAMKAAGLKPLVEIDSKKPENNIEEEDDSDDDDKDNEPSVQVDSKVEIEEKVESIEVVVPEPVVEDDDDDDWEAVADNIDSIKLNTKVSATNNDNEDEDLLEIEHRKEQEKLRLLGLERKRREEESRIKREQEEKERQEIDRQIREAAMRKEISKNKRIEREAIAKANRSPNNLRAAISCIMGHVDTGKTKLLDKIRNTNVQEGEAGGITQQIGATSFSKETLTIQTQSLQSKQPFEIKIPGLLVIDTPGHESFANLRNRGSSLCDIAILVIDLMHGLEPQTIESINMLVRKNAPFIVALNKVDRLYNWKKLPDGPIRDALALQDYNCISEFNDRTSRIIVQLNELGLNAKLYWENDSLEDTVSICPTSAHSGEGVPDLLMNLIKFTQNRLIEKVMFMDYVQCTVLEVKVMEGLGSSLDVILLHGTIREGDRIVVSTLDGPVTTQIRALLTPPPNREMRVKSEYIHHQSVTGTIGVKIISSTDLTRTVAGTAIMVIHSDDDEEELKEEIQSDLNSVTKLATSSKGVTVHASTLGALEALLQFLQKECKPPIPVSTVNIGTIFKKDIIRTNLMNEKGFPEYATILAFDVKIDSEAEEYAKECSVKIFTADIIYHLFDQFSAYMNGIIEQRKADALMKAVHPCVLKIFPQYIFNKKDPIVVGVEVTDGTLKIHTPLYIPQLGLDIGRVVSIENNHKEVNQAKKGTSVSIKISCESNPNLMYGRQFDHTHALYSKISRDSIDALKEFFKDDVSKEDWLLIVKLKKVFGITDNSKKKTPVDRSKLNNSANSSSNNIVTNDALPGYNDDDSDD